MSRCLGQTQVVVTVRIMFVFVIRAGKLREYVRLFVHPCTTYVCTSCSWRALLIALKTQWITQVHLHAALFQMCKQVLV